MTENIEKPRHFIQQIIDTDLATGKQQKIITRFPPEPNGFLHIGHAKSFCLNFDLAAEFKGQCHLRFDDTNPAKEDQKYVDAIIADIQWMGFDWADKLFFSSDYFSDLYQFAVGLIKKDLAFVCELNAEEMAQYRGSLTEAGKNSPYRERPIAESLDLFARMRAGEFADGSYSLRAKIDMRAANMHMRDPVLYRIRKITHQRCGDTWPIYPMYDFGHCLSDALEGITHSCCTLEFEEHRPLYDWVIEHAEAPCHPQQIEFSRLNLEFTIMSKRHLLKLVEDGHVCGWDDPRLPTLSGMRRRGYLPASLRHFCRQTGVTKKNNTIAMSTLEAAVREGLGPVTARVFGVLDPLKIILTNWDGEAVQEIEAPYHPQDESFGTRTIPFAKEIYIERDDFKEEANRKFFRLKKGGKVRLKYAYVITCDEVIKDAQGKILELHCRYHKDSFGGVTPEGMGKVKGIIHWVSAQHAVPVEARMVDRLFNVPNPLADKTKDFSEFLNSDSLKIIHPLLEPSIQSAKIGERFQFERQGYFIVDPDSSLKESPGGLIFNRIITLKDTWANIEKEFQT